MILNISYSILFLCWLISDDNFFQLCKLQNFSESSLDGAELPANASELPQGFNCTKTSSKIKANFDMLNNRIGCNPFKI